MGHNYHFTTGLPNSKGKTAILAIVDHFTKVAYFVHLLKFPSVFESAIQLIAQFFLDPQYTNGHCVRWGYTVHLSGVKNLL